MNTSSWSLKKISIYEVTANTKGKKAKRKAKQPADCAGEPDPERWIPKRDRSGYKKTRREKKLAKSVVKGSQGAGKVNEMLDKSQAPVDTTRGPNLPNLPRRRKR